MSIPTELSAWNELKVHYEDEGKNLDMRRLFEQDPERFKRLSLRMEQPNLLLDYSKNLVNHKTLSLLFKLAREAGVEGERDRMFAGESINNTEERAVLHVALRNIGKGPMKLGSSGMDVMPAIKAELGVMQGISEGIRMGNWRGYSGERIKNIVNIGIGGSDLGPVMVCEALKHYKDPGLNFHFISNVDGSHLAETLKTIDAATTLFIIVSKTFTTAETMANAQSAKAWFLEQTNGMIEGVRKHFVAVSTNADRVTEFGISPSNMIKFWDWVGGRYSLWSAVGLSIMISIGYDRFMELLMGANAMDVHFQTQPLERNIPVVLAMLGIWYNNFFGAQTHAILPYEQYLHRFPAYLQQADMESNGKSTTFNGTPISSSSYQTGPIIWGEPGTNGQHAFFQLLHQGTKLIPADFIVARKSLNPIGNGIHHKMLLANCLAQTEALMMGKSFTRAEAELTKESSSSSSSSSPCPMRKSLLAAHKSFPGNRPTSTIVYDLLTPSTLGALISLYEHKIFVQGIVWKVNSFDQWGVELGKQLASALLTELEMGKVNVESHDGSTIGLLNYILGNNSGNQKY